jgi:hypothetical protein
MESESIILKQDTRGRVCTPKARREVLVAEFERSGLSARRFAALAGVRYNTFWTWLKSRPKQDGRKAATTAGKPVRFAEVVVDAQPPAPVSGPPVLLVTLPGGAVLSLTQAAQMPLAVELIKAFA